ncbi:MAG: hypothetical protein IJ735_00810 [Clostridia bacterium]|nr:hypothetical protein [Clostridia bacterium]
MKKYDSGQKGALLAMVCFLVLAAVFFALIIVFFQSAGGVFTALWLFSVICTIICGARFLTLTADRGRRSPHNKSSRMRREPGPKEEENDKSDTLREFFFYDETDEL